MDRRGQRAVLPVLGLGAAAALLVAMAGGIALAAVTPELLLAGVVLALTGTVLAPSAVLSYLSAERLRAGTTAPMLAGAAVLLAAAFAVLMRRAAFDERGNGAHAGLPCDGEPDGGQRAPGRFSGAG